MYQSAKKQILPIRLRVLGRCMHLDYFKLSGESWCVLSYPNLTTKLVIRFQDQHVLYFICHVNLSQLCLHHIPSRDLFFTYKGFQFSSVESLSRVRLFATSWIAAHQASLSSTNSWSSVKLMSIESVKPSNHFITHVHWIPEAIQPLHPLSSPSPPFFSLSQHQDLFQWVSSSYQVAKVLEPQL